MMPHIKARLWRHMNSMLFAIAVIYAVIPATAGIAGDPLHITPLFPVQRESPFTEPKETFEEVKDLILQHYYNDRITEDTLYWAAVRGMLRHISPPENPDLSKLWDLEEYAKISDALHGVKLSLGIQSTFNPLDGSLTVTHVSPETPAERVLAPHDRILRINGAPLKGLSLPEVNGLLEGEEGASVTLTVNRDIDMFDVALTFRKYASKKLLVTPLTDRLALIEINYFISDISGSLKKELITLAENGTEALIIDLRNNSGGVFIEALKMVELFLPENHILLRTFQREIGLQNYTSVNPHPFEFDMAILVNDKTASSAEILAAALQDHHKAIIIGVKTFGKGVFEKTFTLDNGCRVKFITGAMYSPKGTSWQGKGITPDFIIEQDDATLSALLRLPPKDRFHKDVAMITAYKLLTR